jgi:hypothetical protein
MRARKNFNPKGAQEFFRGLSKINVPKDIARNTERWKEVQMDEPIVFKTPPGQPLSALPRVSPAEYYRNFIRKQTAKSKQWVNY